MSWGTVFRYELVRNLQRRGFLFATFGLPLIAALIVFGAQIIGQRAGADTSTPENEQRLAEAFASAVTRIGVVDDSGTLPPTTGLFEERVVRYTTVDALRAAVRDGTVELGYRLPPDYIMTGAVEKFANSFSPRYLDDDLFQGYLLDTLAPDASNADVRLLTRGPTITAVARETATGIDANSGSAFGIVYATTLIMLLGLFTTNGYLLQTVVQEKENKLLEVLLSSVQPNALLAGKILALGLLGLLQLAVWAGAAALLLAVNGGEGLLSAAQGFRVPLNVLAWATLFFVAGYFLLAAFMGGIGALVNTTREASQFSAFFLLPMVIPLYLIQVFINNPASPLAVGLSLVPLTAPTAMVQRLLISPVPVWQLALSLTLLVLTAAAVQWVAARLFRAQTLLAGQRPRLRDIPALLRG